MKFNDFFSTFHNMGLYARKIFEMLIFIYFLLPLNNAIAEMITYFIVIIVIGYLR